MVRVTGLTRLAKVTGEDSPNATASRFGVRATDLGIVWDDGRGGVLVAFGDTYGEGWSGHGAGPGRADWRFNVLGRSTNRDLDGGLLLDWMAPREDGCARQIVPADRGSVEHTVIPTAGIAVGGRNYLHYMSIRRWGGPDGWRTNYGGLAYSDDGGATWAKSDTAVWANTGWANTVWANTVWANTVWANSKGGWLNRLFNRSHGRHPFQMIAYAGLVDRHVYLLGTPNGRFGSGHLARVGEDDILDHGAYEYWTDGTWSSDAFDAAPVLSAPVAELSVRYNSHFGLWFAVHLDEHRAAIVLRTAPQLAGPWTKGDVVAAGADYPALYGGFQHPWATDRPVIYFTMSQWGPYNVYLLRADLE